MVDGGFAHRQHQNISTWPITTPSLPHHMSTGTLEEKVLLSESCSAQHPHTKGAIGNALIRAVSDALPGSVANARKTLADLDTFPTIRKD